MYGCTNHQDLFNKETLEKETKRRRKHISSKLQLYGFQRHIANKHLKRVNERKETENNADLFFEEILNKNYALETLRISKTFYN